MSETRNSGGGAPPNGAAPSSSPAGGDDLRTMIAGALADNLAATPGPTEPPAPAGGDESPAVPPAGGEPGEPGAPGGERPAGETPPGPAAPPARPDGGEAPAAGEQPAGPAGREAEAPQHWSAADREEFNGLPETARAPFLRMYKRMESGFQPRLQRGAQLERDYGELDRTVFTQPQRELIGRLGQTPVGIINTWANIERALDRNTNPNNPALRNDILARMIHNYGADPGEIARLLNQLRGFPAQQGSDQPPPGPGGNGAGAPAGAAPPNGLEQRLNALETGYNERQAAEQRARYAEAERQIAEFANAKDADGALMHPFFAEVEQDMTDLARLTAQGQTPVLQDLYDRAVWARPSTREKLLASQRDAEAKRAAEERKAKAEAAKRAAVSVNGAPGPGQAPQSTPDRSLRDEIRAQVKAGDGTR